MPAGHAFGVRPLSIQEHHRPPFGLPDKLLCFWQLHMAAGSLQHLWSVYEPDLPPSVNCSADLVSRLRCRILAVEFYQ